MTISPQDRESLVALAEPLVELISAELANRSEPLFVALDGRSGSGKSTLAAVVAQMAGVDEAGTPLVTVIEGDQFYAGGSAATWDSRSPEQKVVGVIDWRRQRQVLEALRRDRFAAWHEFDWDSYDWDSDRSPLAPELVGCAVTPVVILEGAYSARPELADLLDRRVLLDVPADVRRARLIHREGEGHRADWEQRWAEAEDLYFGQVLRPEDIDLVIG